MKQYSRIIKILSFLLFSCCPLWGEPIFRIQVGALKGGDILPTKYTCDSENLSPPLSWEYAPRGTKSFVLFCDDPDASAGTWVHWILYNIPQSIQKLPEGFGDKKVCTLQYAIKQGINSWGEFGYGGACPPRGSGVHRYIFTLFALDIDLDFEGQKNITKMMILEKITDHIIDQSKFIATYRRN